MGFFDEDSSDDDYVEDTVEDRNSLNNHTSSKSRLKKGYKHSSSIPASKDNVKSNKRRPSTAAPVSSKRSRQNTYESSSSSSLSAKELEVLRKQRQVASQISGIDIKNRVATTATAQSSSGRKTSSSTEKRLASSSLSQQRRMQTQLLQSMQRKKLEGMLKPTVQVKSGALLPYDEAKKNSTPSTTYSKSITKHKRPTIMKRTLNNNIDNKSASTTGQVVQEAKNRFEIQKKANKQTITKGGGGSSGTLGNLVIASSSSSSRMSHIRPSVKKHKKTWTINDFWKSIRDWDFLDSLNTHMKTSAVQTKSESEDQSSLKIPNKFSSCQEYIDKWAPLCLQEAKAQTLSDFSSIPKNKIHPIKLDIKPLKKSMEMKCDFIVVQTKIDRDGMRRMNQQDKFSQFSSNDMVLLLSDPKHLHSALSGKLAPVTSISDFSVQDSPSKNNVRHAILGHCEYHRRTPDGLCLKVSREYWTKMKGVPTYIMKIGMNVTALREFTALSRFSSIKLKDYLLCSPSIMLDKAKANPFISYDKRELLKKMGGPRGLGPGFTDYAAKKFNASQLEAISAAAQEYGQGGFTLVKGPPGTGKTTTLVALLNSLHIRQFNKYYEKVGKIATTSTSENPNYDMNQALSEAQRSKPRMLVCAPSNAAVDNIILKIMEDGFIDGRGQRYNPSMVRIGVGQSDFVSDVALEQKVDAYIHESQDIAKLEQSVSAFKIEQYKIRSDISKLRRRLHALATASPYALSAEWEIRIDEETFDTTGRVFFVNHTEKRTSFDIPPPPRRKGEKVNLPTAMPEYQAHMGKIVKLVERFNVVTSKLHRVKISQKLSDELNKSNNKSGKNDGNWNQNCSNIKQLLETHVVDNVHIVLTTLGTAGNRILEQAMKFEVVVIDEAAQSVEPATLVALQLGSSHAILVGDPQQLPATIFSVSGRETKYDRSLFQRLEEAGYPVHMLNTQYRMHPQISCFPRKIFYSGNLKDGPNVMLTKYGNPLREIILKKIPVFQPFTVLDLDSEEERSKQNGTRSLSNSFEARLALHLYLTLEKIAGLTHMGKVAVITPYSQQAELLRKIFYLHFGDEYTKRVEVNTVDAFQGREANIVIFSCVRAAGSTGIGFLSDVRRMNVALTRAKFFLFVIARCESIVVNPYWRDLVRHAMENKAVLPVPLHGEGKQKRGSQFPEFSNLAPLPPPPKPIVSVLNKKKATDSMNNTSQCDSPGDNDEDGEIEELF